MSRTASLFSLGAGLVLVAATALVACDSDSAAPAVPAAARADAPAAFEGPPLPMFGAFAGDVAVRTVDGRRVVVSLDETPLDGVVDRVFTFQTAERFARPVAFDARSARVTLVHGNLFVDAPRRALHLQTAGFDVAQTVAARTLPSDAHAVADRVDFDAPRRTITGIGVSQTAVDPAEGFTMNEARDASEYIGVERTSCAASRPFKSLGGLAARPNCDNGDCPAGGPGSTGCSGGGCTVTCGDGYYSCCDRQSCNCCSG